MSDISVLSHEYNTASEFSQAINRALIVLKKIRLGLPAAEAVTPEHLEASQCCLAEALMVLIPLLDPARTPEVQSSTAARVPGALVTRLRREHRGDLAYYLDDLRLVAQHLRAGVSKLTDRDLGLLDQLAAAADAETSSVFRRMMRT